MIHLSRREHLPFFVQFLDHFFINIATNLTVTYKPCTFSILILQLTMQYKSIVVLGKFSFLHCFSLSCFNWVSTYKFTVWCPIYGNLMNFNCLHVPSEFGEKRSSAHSWLAEVYCPIA